MWRITNAAYARATAVASGAAADRTQSASRIVDITNDPPVTKSRCGRIRLILNRTIRVIRRLNKVVNRVCLLVLSQHATKGVITAISSSTTSAAIGDTDQPSRGIARSETRSTGRK